MIFAGIGSRETPADIQEEASLIGKELTDRGFLLRSGGARGFDRAVEKLVAKDRKEIFLHKDSRPEWFEHAKIYHPKWHKLDYIPRALHARNSAIILGEDLNSRVNFIICWTKDGQATGGTGQGLRIAKDLKIPVFNMFYKNWKSELDFFLDYF